MIIRWIQRRRARRTLANLSQAERARVLLAAMTPKESAHMLREAIEGGRDAELDDEVVALMAERAADGAAGPGRTILQKIATAYREGRSIKYITFPPRSSATARRPR